MPVAGGAEWKEERVHTRITTLFPKSDRMELVRGRVEELIPAMSRQPGFLGATVMSDGETVVCMTIWQSSETMEASRRAEYFQESVSRVIMFLKKPPEVRHYEVNTMS